MALLISALPALAVGIIATAMHPDRDRAGDRVLVTRSLMLRPDRVDKKSRKCEPGPNGPYLSTVDSTIDRKLVTGANLKFVSPAKAGVQFCMGHNAWKIGPRPSPGRQ